MIVNRADRYGLAQLYQLRGRVGRADRRAYAYLLVPPGTVLSEVARKRLAAIREFSELGAGFRIAALDLELRAAGNLLGGAPAGHTQAVALHLRFAPTIPIAPEALVSAVRHLPGATLSPQGVLRVPVPLTASAPVALGAVLRELEASL